MMAVLQAGRNEHALGLFSIALALHIKDARVKCILHNNTGMAYNSLGQHINAIAECHLAEAACPTFWQTYFTRAAAFDHIGLASEAVQVCFDKRFQRTACLLPVPFWG
jgi:tetratricopeptide (TPR) repeat protein